MRPDRARPGTTRPAALRRGTTARGVPGPGPSGRDRAEPGATRPAAGAPQPGMVSSCPGWMTSGFGMAARFASWIFFHWAASP